MTVLELVTSRLNRLARSRLLTMLLLAGSLTFVAVRWRDARWETLAGTDIRLLLLSALVYAVALAALIAVVVDSGGRPMVAAGASTQLLKYLPGGFWQGQPLLAAGRMADVGAYAWGALVAAGTAAAVGAGGWLALGAGVTTVGVGGFGVWRFGVLRGTMRFLYAMGAGVAIVVSGAIVSLALGKAGWSDGQAVGLSWAAGVFAVPVPAGIGVREAMLSVLGGVAAAPLAAAHRLVTLVVDIVVGGAGLAVLHTRSNDRSAIPLQSGEQES